MTKDRNTIHSNNNSHSNDHIHTAVVASGSNPIIPVSTIPISPQPQLIELEKLIKQQHEQAEKKKIHREDDERELRRRRNIRESGLSQRLRNLKTSSGNSMMIDPQRDAQPQPNVASLSRPRRTSTRDDIISPGTPTNNSAASPLSSSPASLTQQSQLLQLLQMQQLQQHQQQQQNKGLSAHMHAVPMSHVTVTATPSQPSRRSTVRHSMFL